MSTFVRRNFHGNRHSQRSIVWEFYRKRADGVSATCRLCKQTSKHFGNTTNLMSHLKRRHPVEFQKTRAERDFSNAPQPQNSANEIAYPIETASNHFVNEPGIQYGYDDGSSEYIYVNGNGIKQEVEEGVGGGGGGLFPEQERGVLNEELLDMLIMDFQHPTFIEQAGFDYFTKVLCPVLTIPSVEEVTERLIPGRYYSQKNSVMELLIGSEYVGLSASFYNCINKEFVTVSACFISDFKFKRFPLATKTDFKNCLSEVLEKWGLHGKVTAITIDNPAKVNIDQFEVNLSNFKSICGDFRDLIWVDKIRNILNYFRNDENAVRKLKENGGNAQELFNLKIMNTNKLKQSGGNKVTEIKVDYKSDNVEIFDGNKLVELIGCKCESLNEKRDFINETSDFGKNFNTIEWFVNNQTPITIVLNSANSPPENLKPNEMEILIDWFNLQQPIYKVFSELTNNCTISCLIPLYRGLQSLILKKNVSTQFGVELKEKLLKSCTQLADESERNSLMAKACLLDPRFKKFGFTNEACVAKSSEDIIDELMLVLQPILEDNSASAQDAKRDNRDEDDLWGDFNEKIAGVSSSARSVCSGILQKYLALPVVDRRSDPLHFWQEHCAMFPSLKKLALKYLCVPAAPAFTEQLFPKHVDFSDERFFKLNEEQIDMYIFLKGVLNDRCS